MADVRQNVLLNKVEDALNKIYSCLGPEPGCCSCCDGCQCEMRYALYSAKRGKRYLRKYLRKLDTELRTKQSGESVGNQLIVGLKDAVKFEQGKKKLKTNERRT